MLAQILNPSYPIAVVQYARMEFGVGQEDDLHWALIVLTSRSTLTGHCFQAFDRTYRDGTKIWKAHYNPDASLTQTRKCLGGVQVGSVKARRLNDLIKLVKAHPTEPKFDDWNCRDYVLEIVELMRERGWTDASFPTGDERKPYLFTRFKLAGQGTKTARVNGGSGVDIQWLARATT